MRPKLEQQSGYDNDAYQQRQSGDKALERPAPGKSRCLEILSILNILVGPRLVGNLLLIRHFSSPF
jgi:hypothetical protein